MIENAFWAIFPLYVVGAGAAVLVRPIRRALVLASSCAVLAGGLEILVGGGVLGGAPPPTGQLKTGLPFGPLTLAVDALGAFFLGVIGVVSLAVAIYAVGYLDRHAGHHPLRSTLALFNLLLLTLVLTVTVADAVAFLIAWESMAVVSYLAVTFEYEDLAVTRAGYLMLAVGQLGTVGIIGAFLLLGTTGDGFSFAALRDKASHLSTGLRDLVFILAFFGFGAKAGIVPLQSWLPEAHPAAPGHISAILSGLVVKMGLYGMLRLLIDILGVGPVWWGLVTLGMGAGSALVGILHAFVDRDLKRILAYSTIENVGIVVAAIGLSMVYRAFSLNVLAAIAGLFALYHLLGHAVSKGLLFLGAGAVEYATGTRDLERLGGLIHRLRWTTFACLIGSLALAAVAPFAGYISEWGIIETMLQGFAVPDIPSKLVIAVTGAGIALTAALAMTVFVRAFAVGFLALPRSSAVSTATEVPASMQAAMGLLVVVSLALGALPSFVTSVLDQISTLLWGTSVLDRVVPPLFTTHPGDYAVLIGLGGGVFRGLPVNGLVIVPSPSLSTINSPTYLILAEAVILSLVGVGVRLVQPLGARRVAPVWGGGIPRFEPSMQYGAVAYSNPARLIFNDIYHSHTELRVISGAAANGEGQINYLQQIPPPLEEGVYRPIARTLDAVARWTGAIQSGSINQYILYIFAMVLVILVLQSAVWTSWLTYGLDLLVAGVVLLVLRSLRREDQADHGR